MIKIIHKLTGFDRIQFLLKNYGNESPTSFILAGMKEFNISARVKNFLGRDSVQSTIFVSTHHTGAIDFMAAYPEINKIAPNLKIVVNKHLLKLSPLKSVFIAVHPVSARMKNDLAKRQIIAHLKEGGNVLIYPAGKVARRLNGNVEDFPWRMGLGEVIKEANAAVVPVYVDAENSRFFYTVREFFPKLSLLFLLRELKNSSGKTATVYIGKAMEQKKIFKFENKKLVQEIRNQAYALIKEVSYE